MIRFLHSADWQLGARFPRFGARAAALRHARMTTLRRMVREAVRLDVDFLLIAGDLFEDNQVEDRLVAETVAVLAEAGRPVFLLPGNHDPLTGPDCVWNRRAFREAPSTLHVLRTAGTVEVRPGVALVASPLSQKKSSLDPSLPLVALSSALPAETLRIGVTHGSLAIESKHQDNDFPIALDAATRAGLDYLGVGHWHGWLEGTDGGRILMPGTPEADRFGTSACGRVALVEIDGRGGCPRVTPVPVATLSWRELELDFLDGQAPTAARRFLDDLAGAAGSTVVRIRMHGPARPEDLEAVRTLWEERLPQFAAAELRDETRVAPGAAEWESLRDAHPLLAQVLADLDQLEVLVTGKVPSGDAVAADGSVPVEAMSPQEARRRVEAEGVDWSELGPEHVAVMRRLLFHHLPKESR